jgi:hypothetical protein
MSQTMRQDMPANHEVAQASAAHGATPWLLETDKLLLMHLYAQRDEQLEQLAALRRGEANQNSISIVEQQIAGLNHAIRHAEEQAALHARQIEIRRVE